MAILSAERERVIKTPYERLHNAMVGIMVIMAPLFDLSFFTVFIYSSSLVFVHFSLALGNRKFENKIIFLIIIIFRVLFIITLPRLARKVIFLGKSSRLDLTFSKIFPFFFKINLVFEEV